MKTNCENCPLKGSKPVPCEYPEYDAKYVLLGESPGRNKEIEGKPFVGASGYLLNRTLANAGIDRYECLVTNTVMCRPNKHLSPNEWRRAIECCKPRLMSELRSCPLPVFAMGAKALYVLTGKAKITPWVGAPLRAEHGQEVLPSFHPDACLRKPAMIPVFQMFVKRFKALANGHLKDWIWPPFEIYPGAKMHEILERLAHTDEPIGVDVETAGTNPLYAPMLCLGLASPSEGVSIPWPTNAHNRELVEQVLNNRRAIHVMHNASHDLLTLEASGLSRPTRVFDTLLAHATVAPQLPHGLSFVAACEFHAPRWKSEYRIESDLKGTEAFTKRPLDELCTYNFKDSTMTAMLQLRLQRQVAKTYKGQELFDEYTALAAVALKMQRHGVLVDKEAKERHRVKLTTRREETRKEFAKLVPNLDLGKSAQNQAVKDLFFETFGCAPIKYSEDTREPSLDAMTLESYVSQGGLVGASARAVLKFRKDAKLLSTYIDGLPVTPDGCVHPTWKVYGTLTGRWSSADPNAQNQPKAMRDMYIARLGKKMVAADFSQLELRIIALLANDEKLLDAYDRGEDVHQLNANDLFNKSPASESDRKLAKGFVYGVNYGGDAETIWRALIVKFPDLRLGTVRHLMRMWKKTHPAIHKYQQQLLKDAEQNCYVEAPLSGRREYFHDGHIEGTKVLNYPIQSTAGDIMNRAILRVDKELDWSKEAILFQVHDELVLEGPDSSRLCRILKGAMEEAVILHGHKVSFPVDLSVGTAWNALEEV